MTAESDITAINDGGANTALEVRSALTSVLARADSDPFLTTKGDLLTYGTAAQRLGVGTDGQVLTADAAEAAGVKWATPTTWTEVTSATLGSAASTMGVSGLSGLGYQLLLAKGIVITTAISAPGVQLNSITTSTYGGWAQTDPEASARSYVRFINTSGSAGSFHFYMFIFDRFVHGAAKNPAATTSSAGGVFGGSSTDLASDIDALTFMANSGNLDTGSTVTVWGL